MFTPDPSLLAPPTLPPLERLPVRVVGEAGLPPEGVVRDDVLAAEVPVALVFNGISHAVMMATPQDLEDFALGFALSEGILDSAADCRGIDVEAVDATAAGLPEGVAGVDRTVPAHGAARGKIGVDSITVVLDRGNVVEAL